MEPDNYNDMTPRQRAQKRREYVEHQNGMCACCESPLAGPPPPHIKSMKIISKLFPIGFFKHPIHLDHDHDTGMTRGAVHAHCNAVMWQYGGL